MTLIDEREFMLRGLWVALEVLGLVVALGVSKSAADVIAADHVKAWTNIRKDIGGPVIGSLPVGDTLALIDEQGDWYHVRTDQTDGFVSKAKARRLRVMVKQAAQGQPTVPVRVEVTNLPASLAPSTPQPSTLQTVFQDLAWIATALGVIGVAFGIFKGQHELRISRRQRDEEHIWKRVETAKELNDSLIEDLGVRDALLMIDYPQGRHYVLPAPTPSTIFIQKADVVRALQPGTTHPVPPMERFIRDAFDRLFYHMGILEHYVGQNLIDFNDIKHPIDYYVQRMNSVNLRLAVDDYIDRYNLYKAKAFLKHKW